MTFADSERTRSATPPDGFGEGLHRVRYMPKPIQHLR